MAIKVRIHIRRQLLRNANERYGVWGCSWAWAALKTRTDARLRDNGNVRWLLIEVLGGASWR